MICKNCGHELKNGARFCAACGSAVENNLNGIYQNQQGGAVAKKVKVNRKPFDKRWFIAIGAGALAIIVGIICIVSLSATKDLKNAIKSKSASRVEEVYNKAYGKKSKLKKYDKIIANTLDEMYKDINDHDFDSAAKTSGSDAVESYLVAKWGSLLENEYGYTTIMNCVSDTNEMLYDLLDEICDSKIDYCDGVYYYAKQEYYDSMVCFGNVITDDKEYDNAQTLLGESTTAYLNESFADAEAEFAKGDYEDGIEELERELKSLDKKYDSFPQAAQTKINEAVSAYAQTYVTKADGAFKQKDITAAVNNIEIACKLQPTNTDYAASLANYKQYSPFCLYTEKNVLIYKKTDDGLMAFGNKEWESNDGQKFENCMSVWFDCPTTKMLASAAYSLGGNYDTVSGKLFIPKPSKNDELSAYYEAYGDGTLIYTSPTISTGELPKDTSFSVEGIQQLEIKFYGNTTSGIWGTQVYISNFAAQKNLPA